MRNEKVKIAETTQEYESVLKQTNRKLAEMEKDKIAEFHKVAEAFREVREAVFRRESEIKKLLYEQIA